MSLVISLPQDDSPQQRYQRERHLAAQRALYEWQRRPGLPPSCKGVPAPERFSELSQREMAADVLTSVANGALSLYGWLRRNPTKVDHFNALYRLRRPPSVIDTWRSDKEFARQRMNGVNPFLITSIDAIPENFPVTDETLRGVLPDGVGLRRLLDERRLFLCDWKEIADAPLELGRYQVAPLALFWLDGSRTLMPLAIQLGQSPAEAPVIFTPADPFWLWLTARTYVASADGTYHELIVHLARTHLAMERVWVAACRTLPPEHPLNQLLRPHFDGTIAINDEAFNNLLGPGGPIDQVIAVGVDGGLWLCEQETQRWRLDHWNPRADLARRGVDDPDVLPGYYYRDDALGMFDAIGDFTAQLLGVYYPNDEVVRSDSELQAFARELIDADGADMKGTPIASNGRFETFTDVHRFVHQVIYTVSAEHGAVNNGQWDQFGYIPNTPGSMYIPVPTDKRVTDEARFVYALPGFHTAIEQMAVAALLSEPTLTPLGSYPDQFFVSSRPAESCVDRFRSRLDDVSFAIDARNAELPASERYTYLLPSNVGRSITI